MLYCILVYAKLIFKKIVPSFNLSDKLAIPNFSRFFFQPQFASFPLWSQTFVLNAKFDFWFIDKI